MDIWMLRKGADRRFRSGHPWVFSNELAKSPALVEPGAPVELRAAGGGFLARGYGHPHSLIAFRALSRDPAQTDPWSADAITAKLRAAAHLRRVLGLDGVSHRLVFAEADGLPGVVIDRYRLSAPEGAPLQLFALQAHTAGAERLQGALLQALQTLVEEASAQGSGGVSWERTGVVLRNDVSIRRLEGLPANEVRVMREPPGVDLARAQALIAEPLNAGNGTPSPFRVDLLGGQKTGFYLDHTANVRLAAERVGTLLRHGAGNWRNGPLRVLDLFCYGGQWGAQLTRVAARFGRETRVTAVDASTAALELARANVEAAGGACEAVKRDALADLRDLPARTFDVVVVDPPPLIKGRKALHVGRAAYRKLNMGALRLARPGGLYVTCSCSQLLDETELLAILDKAARRSEVAVQWVARGGQAPDHPVLGSFPEGRYLKCLIGLVSMP